MFAPKPLETNIAKVLLAGECARLFLSIPFLEKNGCHGLFAASNRELQKLLAHTNPDIVLSLNTRNRLLEMMTLLGGLPVNTFHMLPVEKGMLVATGASGRQGLPWHERHTRGRIQRSFREDREKHTNGACDERKACRVKESISGTSTYCLSQSPSDSLGIPTTGASGAGNAAVTEKGGWGLRLGQFGLDPKRCFFDLRIRYQPAIRMRIACD